MVDAMDMAREGRRGILRGRGLASVRRLAIALVAWGAAGSGVSSGAMVLTLSSASTTYSLRALDVVANNQGTNAVSATGQLLSVRNFFNSQLSNGEPENFGDTQTFRASGLATAFSNTATGYLIGDGESFGAASTNLSTVVNGSIAAGAGSRTGLNWFSTAATSTDYYTPFSTVAVTTATATFVNNSTTAVTGTPGASVAMTGTLADFDFSYVAASLVTTIRTTVGNVTSTINLPAIIFGYGFIDGQLRTQVASATYASLSINGLGYSFSGVNRAANPVTFGLNDGFTVTSTLTLIADPSSVGVDEMTDPEALAYLPDFGTFVQNPSAVAAVPEPLTLAPAAFGLIVAGAFGWRRSRARD